MAVTVRWRFFSLMHAEQTQLHSSKKPFIITSRRTKCQTKQLQRFHLGHAHKGITYSFLNNTPSSPFHSISPFSHLTLCSAVVSEKCEIACPVSAAALRSLIRAMLERLNKPSEVVITQPLSAAIIALAKLTIK